MFALVLLSYKLKGRTKFQTAGLMRNPHFLKVVEQLLDGFVSTGFYSSNHISKVEFPVVQI